MRPIRRTAAAACLLALAAATPAEKPLLKPEQVKYLEDAKAAAITASAEAEQELLHIFRSVKFRLELIWNGLGHNAWKMAFTPATELLGQIKGALEFTEYTTNFGVDPTWRKDHPGEPTMDFDTIDKYGYIPNMWELRAAKSPLVAGTPTDQWGVMEAAEDGLYQMPISGKLLPAGPNVTEALDRPQYIAGNLRRIDIGVARYGSYAAVLRNDVIQDRSVVLPSDSGGWENICNSSVKPIQKWYPIFGQPLSRCKSMFKYGKDRPVVGTADNQLHTLLSNSLIFGKVGGSLSRLVYQLLVPEATTRRFETLFYTEAGVLGAVRPQDMKLMVASFPGIFGTPEANRLRLFCTTHKIPLAWALNGGETWSASMKNWKEWLPYVPEFEPVGADRIIDPITWTLTNATVKLPPLWKVVWDAVVAEIEARRKSKNNLKASDFQVWWDRIMAFGGGLHPMRHGDCHAKDMCSGVYTSYDGKTDCLCKGTQPNASSAETGSTFSQSNLAAPVDKSLRSVEVTIV